MDKGLFLRDIRVFRHGHPLIKVNHDIYPGEVLTLMGPSGVGKSTLLAFITGTLSSDFTGTGSIILNGIEITSIASNARRIGILFQEDLLFPHMSVGANLAFGMTAGGRKSERLERINAALGEVGLAGFADRDPATLSGGQKARVALVRMLLSNPQALLLDEAFSRLDTELRTQVRDLVFRIAKEQALPVLMVTHDADDATAAGGAIIELERLNPE